MTAQKLDSITFESPLVREFSSTPTPVQLGTHTTTMELFKVNDSRFYIEWDLTAIEEFMEYGIWTETNSDGKQELVDYDGGFSLPIQAIELLRKNNIIVPKDFE
jgi:hypothetical protein